MRALAVFLVTYISSISIFVYSYHAFLERASVSAIALYLVALGCVFGAVASWWRWSLAHPLAFLSASFLAAMTILFPFVVVTYGFALRAFPLVVLWIAMNSLGFAGSSFLRQRSNQH